MAFLSQIFQKIGKVWNDLLTGKDNLTHDIGRWGIAFALLYCAAQNVYQETHGIHSNIKDVAQAFALLLGGGGLGLWAKSKTEPGA